MRQWRDGNSSSAGTGVIFSLLHGSSRQAVIGCLAFVVLLGSLSCSRTASDSPEGVESKAKTVSTIPPFITREPQRYRATRTVLVTETSDGVTTTRKTVTTVARDEGNRREEYQSDDGRKVIFVENDDGKFVLDPSAKTYRDLSDSTAVASGGEFPTVDEMFAETHGQSNYERLGSEELDHRSTVKYRVTTPGKAGETFVWFDENLGMIVRSEARVNGQGFTAEVIMTLQHVALDVDENLFRLPADFKKTSGGKL